MLMGQWHHQIFSWRHFLQQRIYMTSHTHHAQRLIFAFLWHFLIEALRFRNTALVFTLTLLRIEYRLYMCMHCMLTFMYILVYLSAFYSAMSFFWAVVGLYYFRYYFLFMHVQYENSKWKSCVIFNTHFAVGNLQLSVGKLRLYCLQLFNPRRRWNIGL